MNKSDVKRSNLVRPTVRLDREFDKMLKIKMVDKGITFQDLTSKLLEKWLKCEVEVI